MFDAAGARQADEQAVRISDAQSGDAVAFGALVQPEQAAALRVATVVLGTSEGADDVVQLAIERAWRSLASFEVGRPFRPWYLRIVANCARNDRRARGRRGRLQVRVAATSPTSVVATEDLAVADDDRRRVVAAINRLSESDRLVIALRHFEDLSERQMADALRCRPGTVKSRLSRAMSRLRAELERPEVDDG